MTTCEDMTFERLLAHIELPGGDPELQQHLAECKRCSARVIAVRMQSLTLAALARSHHASAPAGSPLSGLSVHGSGIDDINDINDNDGPLIVFWAALREALAVADDEVDAPVDAPPNETSGDLCGVPPLTTPCTEPSESRGPAACLGAAIDAGLASYQLNLRELFAACVWSDPRRGRQLLPSQRPRRIRKIVDELNTLARRLSGLGLAITTDGLPTMVPAAERVHAVANPILERLVALEGNSAWVTQAREILDAPPSDPRGGC